jgi:hypothetical protein
VEVGHSKVMRVKSRICVPDTNGDAQAGKVMAPTTAASAMAGRTIFLPEAALRAVCGGRLRVIFTLFGDSFCTAT